MEKITRTVEKYTISDKKCTRETVLATELYEKFGKKVKYPAILRLINTKGVQFISEKSQELEKRGVLNWKLLCWHANRVKIIYGK
jgi:hypothetical protein